MEEILISERFFNKLSYLLSCANIMSISWVFKNERCYISDESSYKEVYISFCNELSKFQPKSFSPLIGVNQLNTLNDQLMNNPSEFINDLNIFMLFLVSNRCKDLEVYHFLERLKEEVIEFFKL